jgi:micrococcal nuclease
MKKTLFAFFLAFSSIAYANDMRMPYVAVIDGDTIRSSVQLPCPLCNVYIRIKGIDTPESNHLAKCEKEKITGMAAKKYLQNVFIGKTEFMARNMDWDKYGGRIVADVEVDGKSLAEDLIKRGYAKPYAGRGRKPNWCN